MTSSELETLLWQTLIQASYYRKKAIKRKQLDNKCVELDSASPRSHVY